MMKILRALIGLSMLLSMITPVLPATIAAAAPLPARQAAPASAALLPAWMESPKSAALMPAWYEASQSKSPQPAPVQRNQVFKDISNSLLTVDVFGPASASIGAPAGAGETYTAVIRNNSSDVAYGVSLTATHESFMVYDDFSELISSTGTITPLTFVSTPTSLQWTPVTTYNLAAGEAITLSFKLRAECNGVSGQRLEVGVNYNAEPGEPSDETNVGGLNVTLGRGNLVINKYPALQELGTGDFGKPITWTVEVQNTGLGRIYSATITDTGGENLGQPTGDLTPTDTIDVLDINEIVTYTVVGTVEACNFTNVAEGAWSCGNIEGDGYYTNPVTSTVSVLFNPDVPRVELAVSDPLTFSYCGADIHTVTITATDLGGAAGDLRIASNLANHGFLDILTGTVGGDWTYDDASGRFSYQGGPPTGTLRAGEAVTLTFQVQPNVDVCRAGSGSLTFTPLYRDVCANEPFTGTPQSLAYAYAQGEAPTLGVVKDGPSVVASGETFTYEITLSGSNAQNISGTIYVTDTLPSEFELQGAPMPSVGTVEVSGAIITWTFPSTHTPGTDFSETLLYQVKAITVTGGDCGAGEQVNNSVEAFAQPTCDACDAFTRTAQVDTIIVNQEGVIPAQNAVGAFEVCGEQGFTITNRYEITGSTVVTWAGAVFTEALGADIGAGALPTGSAPLEYRNALSVVIDGVDYTIHVTETETGGPLVLDLGGLDGLAPTQTFVLYITYTVGISEASLDGAVEQTFYDWTQLYLPNSRSGEVCADNSAFNQAFELTISRGDLSVGLSPPILNRCETNRAVIQVNDRISGALTNNIVVTFTSSSEQIETARNFTYAGSLAGISPITVTSGTIGGWRSVITFTLPPGEDLDGDGAIEFDIDVGCTGRPPWRAGITFESRCGFPHRHATARSHNYRAPSLILFATPIRYTLREREPTWKFFVTNNGNLTATNVVVTNTASGLTITTFVADGDDITATLPARTGVFTIGEIAPGQQRAVTVTAEAFSCTPLGVDIAARLDCFDDLCGYREARINFITPRPYLRTNNGQTADLPMCDLGQVVFTTKNASPDVNLYRINITETLQQLTPAPGEPFTVTILDRKNNPVETTNNFDPISKTVWGDGKDAVTTTLEWFADLAPTEVATWFQELPPLHTIRITVPVRTSCVAPHAPTGRAVASAEETCGTRFSRGENAVTFQTKEPNLDVIKDGRVDEEDSDWGETVYAAPGQTVTWRLQVINPSGSRAHVAENVVLSDTWPAFFQVVTYTTDYTPTVNQPTRTITWEVGDVALDASLYFYITGTVVADLAACSAQTTNKTSLKFGCDDGCTHDETPVDSADMDSAPNLTVALDPDTFSICEGDIDLTITNEGARAYSTTLTVTMPSGYEVYTYTLGPDAPEPDSVSSLPHTNPAFYWDELPGRISADPYAFTMTLRVQNTGASGACPGIIPETVTATLGYDDHAECDDKGPYNKEFTAPLDVGEPNLVVSKAPAYQTAAVGERVTWTLRVENVGTAMATNVIVTDVVGTNYITVVAGNGSDGATPTTSTIAAGTLITWAPADIAVNGVWTAAVSAALDDLGDNRNVVTATAFCDTGCASATGAATARTTLLQDFAKYPAVQTGTIGSLTVFTFAATLQDRDALYEDLTITDTLPVGLGYVSSVLTYTPDADSGGSEVVSHTPTLSPALYASGPIVWALGDLSGTVEIAGVITAVIQDVGTNQDGVRLVNDLRMTYIDDGVFYVYTDTADVDVLEPILHIGKSYVTPRGCEATLFEDNFNDGNASGWSALGAWNADEGIYDQTTEGTNRRAFAGDQNWTDYSFSFMMRTSNPTGSMGGYVRQGSAGTVDTGYLFRWQNDGVNPGMRLEKRETPVQLLDNNNINYVPGRWYHVEMRVTGDLIEVFVDGTRYLSATDATHPAGRVGLLSSSHTETEFDDVLVTRMDDMACTVGANDLVTYTLTISNQGRLPGYDLVVTDSLPGGMSLVTYTFESDDPATVTDTQPAPIPGATGVLTWGFNQLAPADPFVPTDHTAITMTLVLSVADHITANTVLANQAALAYDGWITDTQPTTITRDYSGGSHSTAVRTVDGGIRKLEQFDPPPTATLGSLVTYTLIVPASPISATLYDVVVTDTIDSRLYIESIDTDPSGAGVSSNFDRVTGIVTATFESIPHDTQAYITVTARISHEWPSEAGDANALDVITNTAVMTHSTATEITTTNEVSTTVGEPNVAIAKSVESSTGSLTELDGAALLTYTLRLENTGDSPAYSLYITDAVPSGISVTALYGGDDRSEPIVGPGTLTWTVGYLSNTVGANVRELTYTARITPALSNATLTNTVDLLYHSLTDTIPGVRPYTDTDQADIETALPTLHKATDPITLRVGDLVTYTLVFTIPAGTVGMGGNSYLYDVLPPGVRYITGTSVLTWTPSAVAPITFTDHVTGVDGASETITWTFGNPITSTQEAPTVITLTFQAQAVGIDMNGVEQWTPYDAIYTILNTVELWQRDEFIDDDAVTNEVIQPVLDIAKDSEPPSGSTVGANERITYTLTITNSGHGPAYDIVISDTLPAGLTYVDSGLVSAVPATATFAVSPTVGSTGVITWRLSPLWGMAWNSGDPGTAVMTVSVDVADNITANIILINTAAIPYYDSQPGDGPGPYDPDEREYDDGEDTAWHQTVNAGIAKLVTFAPPPTATLGSLVTYTLIVPASPISATLYDVVVTDTIDSRLYIESIDTDPSGAGVSSNFDRVTGIVTATFESIPHSRQSYITVTARISHEWPSEAGDANAGQTITNAAVMTHSTATEITSTNQVSTTVGEPALEIVKASDPPTSNTVGAGDAVTYQVTITNVGDASGPAPAYDVVFTDTLPEGMRAAAPTIMTITLDGSPVDASLYITGYNASTGVLTVVFTTTFAFSIPVESAVTIEYVAVVDSDVPSSVDLTNLAEVSWSSLPGDTPGDRDYEPITDTTTLHTAIPAISKGVVPPTVTIGSQVVYTITVPEPIIPAMLYNVIVTDVVDSRLRVDAVSSNATFSGQVVTATFAEIPTNTQQTIVITATVRDLLTVTAGTQISNVAIFDYDSNPGGPISTEPVTVTVAEPHVTLLKQVEAPRDPLGAGDLVTYTLTLSNTGDWPAYDLVVTDSLPLGLDFVGDLGATVTDPTTATTGGAYPVYTASQLNVGGYWYITFTARVQDDITAGVTLTNAAWGAYDGQPGENDDERDYDIPTDTVPVDVGSPALELAKSAEPDPVEAGGLLTYTLTVVNTGIVSATGVLITDTIPENTTFVTATEPHNGPDPDNSAGSVITWTLGTLDIGAPRTVTMTVQVADPLPSGTILTNTAWVTSTEGITDTDTVTTEVESGHTLAITKTASPDPVQAGGLLTYTLEWSVSGNQTALGVMISDTVPVSTTYQDCGPAPCAMAGGVITWTLGDQDPGANDTVTFTVLVDSPLISGTVIHNAAIITDTQGVTDTDEITTPVASAHTLAITNVTLDRTLTIA